MGIVKHRESIRAAVIKRDNRTCRYCGRAKLYGRHLHLDHVHPKSAKGPDTVDNLVVSCKQCNFRKGVRSATAYAKKRIAQLELELATLHKLLECHEGAGWAHGAAASSCICDSSSAATEGSGWRKVGS